MTIFKCKVNLVVYLSSTHKFLVLLVTLISCFISCQKVLTLIFSFTRLPILDYLKYTGSF